MSRTAPQVGVDGAEALLRRLDLRLGLGAAAQVVQARSLEIVRIFVDAPALIMVSRGRKTVYCEDGVKVVAKPGEVLALAGGQTVDFANEVSNGARFEAHWLVFDAKVVATFARAHTESLAGAVAMRRAKLLASAPSGLHNAFARARAALAPDSGLPDALVAHQLQEVLLWMSIQGCTFALPKAPITTASRVRALLAGQLDKDWLAGDVAHELALSEPTLRSRLASEGQTFAGLLMDARMSMALTLLQTSNQPVSGVANTVGYASPSRFAVRFRQRFGFAPSAIRGHLRPS